MLNGTRVFLKNIIKHKNFWPYFFVVITYIILGYRLFSYIWNNTVNILYWDQWDIVDDITQKRNFLTLFLKQHNEHRIGTGLIITKILASLTGWNNKAETVFIGIILLLSSVIALLLKKKMVKKIEVIDIVIPFIFFNLNQWENLTWGFQISFVLPLFFLMVAVYLFSLNDSFGKSMFLLISLFLSVYSSSHGLLLGVVIFLFFLSNYFFNKNKKKRLQYLTFLLFTIFIVSSYFINYKMSESLLGSKSFHLMSIIQYISFQINGLIGYKTYNIFFFIVPAIAVFTFIYLIFNSINSKKMLANFSIISLFLFSFLFSGLTAYGRLQLGIIFGSSPRYLTFMIPLFLGIYLSLCLINNRNFKKSLIPYLTIFFILFLSHSNYLSKQQIINRKESITAWKNCYLEIKNVRICNETYSYPILPQEREEFLEEKIKIIEKYKLNIFSEIK